MATTPIEYNDQQPSRAAKALLGAVDAGDRVITRVIESLPQSERARQRRRRALTLAAVIALSAGGGAIAYDNLGPRQEIAAGSGSIGRGEGLDAAVNEAMNELRALGLRPSDYDQEEAGARTGAILDQQGALDENGMAPLGTDVHVSATQKPLSGEMTYSVHVDVPQGFDPNLQLDTLPDSNPKD